MRLWPEGLFDTWSWDSFFTFAGIVAIAVALLGFITHCEMDRYDYEIERVRVQAEAIERLIARGVDPAVARAIVTTPDNVP